VEQKKWRAGKAGTVADSGRLGRPNGRAKQCWGPVNPVRALCSKTDRYSPAEPALLWARRRGLAGGFVFDVFVHVLRMAQIIRFARHMQKQVFKGRTDQDANVMYDSGYRTRSSESQNQHFSH
jgi:hypothetical protein